MGYRRPSLLDLNERHPNPEARIGFPTLVGYGGLCLRLHAGQPPRHKYSHLPLTALCYLLYSMLSRIGASGGWFVLLNDTCGHPATVRLETTSARDEME
jgi:hypothetical protein